MMGITDAVFEKECEKYLLYLTELASVRYSDCPDRDALVQDAMTVFIAKLRNGESVEHPKAFLAKVLQNMHSLWLREKYKNSLLVYGYDGIVGEDVLAERESRETLDEEYEAVRREIGRLIRIYREVTVRHYVHGHSVKRIAVDLGISEGTVKSRLSTARELIKEGMCNMKKNSRISYEPKKASIGIWGNTGLQGEPFSLVRSDIETNILVSAYETPVSVREISDTMGMPSAYIEPLIDNLVNGELMGRTSGGLVYTRCFVQKYKDSFGDIAAQEELAEKYADTVWNSVWKHLKPVTEREEFARMSEKQKAAMMLFVMNQILNSLVVKSRPKDENSPKEPPKRPNAGRWLATLTVSEYSEIRNNKYSSSGPVYVGYSKNNDGRFDCQMFDCQSVFGDAHWAYNYFKYKCSLQSILRFYASFLPCGVKTDNELLYELIPEFEKLCILKRDEKGEIGLDIPALSFEEINGYWNKPIEAIKEELYGILSEDLKRLWKKGKSRVPKHVDEAAYFMYSGALGAYTKAQLLAIAEKGLMPYKAEVGKTPLIYIAYRKEAE